MQFHMNQNKDLLQKKILMLKNQLIAVNKIKELKIQNARTDFKSFIELMFSETTATCNFQKSFHTDVLIAICQLKADRKLLYKNVIITMDENSKVNFDKKMATLKYTVNVKENKTCCQCF